MTWFHLQVVPLAGHEAWAYQGVGIMPADAKMRDVLQDLPWMERIRTNCETISRDSAKKGQWLKGTLGIGVIWGDAVPQ